MRLELPHAQTDSDVELFLLEPSHVTDQYVTWLNDPATNRYLESRLIVNTVESTRAFVSANLGSSDNVFLGIRYRPAGSAQSSGHVGNIKLGPINWHHRTAELGLLIGDRAVWGKGVASTSILLLCEIARTSLRLRKITAGCYASNIGSRRAFEKAGFSIEGIRKAQCLIDGIPEDVVLFGRCLDEPAG
jgi:[ribosomal protein S5]-alanine N-acetyltransferase